MSYKQREPHPGFKNSSTKQCEAKSKPVSKWIPMQDDGLGWYRILKCTVCKFETDEWQEFEPEGA